MCIRDSGWFILAVPPGTSDGEDKDGEEYGGEKTVHGRHSAPKMSRNDGGVPVEAERPSFDPVSYTHLRAHETVLDLVCRLLLEKNKQSLY